MNELFYSSKDEIRNRVLKNARDLWAIKNTADLDPLVKLLVEALSTELFNISNEVNNLENRMVDKISKILASDTLISAIPAHAILHAKPVESTEILDEKTQFIYGKRLNDKDENNREITVDVFFSPLKPVRIFNAAVAYIATGCQPVSDRCPAKQIAVGTMQTGPPTGKEQCLYRYRSFPGTGFSGWVELLF